MPGFLLNTSSQVMCTHGGKATPAVPLARVKVMGAPAVGVATTYAIAGCPFSTPSGPLPCVTAAGWQGAAVRVTSMNMAVLLATSQAVCSPNGVPTTVVPVEARVKGT
jgi:hypothetical protein